MMGGSEPPPPHRAAPAQEAASPPGSEVDTSKASAGWAHQTLPIELPLAGLPQPTAMLGATVGSGSMPPRTGPQVSRAVGDSLDGLVLSWPQLGQNASSAFSALPSQSTIDWSSVVRSGATECEDMASLVLDLAQHNIAQTVAGGPARLNWTDAVAVPGKTPGSQDVDHVPDLQAPAGGQDEAGEAGLPDDTNNILLPKFDKIEEHVHDLEVPISHGGVEAGTPSSVSGGDAAAVQTWHFPDHLLDSANRGSLGTGTETLSTVLVPQANPSAGAGAGPLGPRPFIAGGGASPGAFRIPWAGEGRPTPGTPPLASAGSQLPSGSRRELPKPGSPHGPMGSWPAVRERTSTGHLVRPDSSLSPLPSETSSPLRYTPLQDAGSRSESADSERPNAASVVAAAVGIVPAPSPAPGAGAPGAGPALDLTVGEPPTMGLISGGVPSTTMGLISGGVPSSTMGSNSGGVPSSPMGYNFGGVPSSTMGFNFGGVPSTTMGFNFGGVPSTTMGLISGGVPSTTMGFNFGGVPSTTMGLISGGVPSSTMGSNSGGVPSSPMGFNFGGVPSSTMGFNFVGVPSTTMGLISGGVPSTTMGFNFGGVPSTTMGSISGGVPSSTMGSNSGGVPSSPMGFNFGGVPSTNTPVAAGSSASPSPGMTSSGAPATPAALPPSPSPHSGQVGFSPPQGQLAAPLLPQAAPPLFPGDGPPMSLGLALSLSFPPASRAPYGPGTATVLFPSPTPGISHEGSLPSSHPSVSPSPSPAGATGQPLFGVSPLSPSPNQVSGLVTGPGFPAAPLVPPSPGGGPVQGRLVVPHSPDFTVPPGVPGQAPNQGPLFVLPVAERAPAAPVQGLSFATVPNHPPSAPVQVFPVASVPHHTPCAAVQGFPLASVPQHAPGASVQGFPLASVPQHAPGAPVQGFPLASVLQHAPGAPVQGFPLASVPYHAPGTPVQGAPSQAPPGAHPRVTYPQPSVHGATGVLEAHWQGPGAYHTQSVTPTLNPQDSPVPGYHTQSVTPTLNPQDGPVPGYHTQSIAPTLNPVPQDGPVPRCQFGAPAFPPSGLSKIQGEDSLPRLGSGPELLPPIPGAAEALPARQFGAGTSEGEIAQRMKKHGTDRKKPPKWSTRVPVPRPDEPLNEEDENDVNINNLSEIWLSLPRPSLKTFTKHVAETALPTKTLPTLSLSMFMMRSHWMR
eukprot:jgi/Botrbrau1/9400/Bobra.0252s0025.1